MTLSQTAILTKQIITISIITIVVSLSSFIGYKIWYAYYLAHLPPVEEKPDVKFGQLPLPNFPKGSVSSSNFSYSIDTSTGNLPKVGIDPDFSKIAKVYFVTKTYATLLSAENSKTLAEKFGIKTDPRVISETGYLFQDDKKSLTIDLDNGNFSYKVDLAISGKDSLDDDNKLVSGFLRELQTLGVFREELSKGRNRVLHLKEGETEFAQISLWPASIDNKLIFTSQFNTSDISAKVYKNTENLSNYLELNFNYYPVEPTTFATYPVKSAEIAFEDLKSGKGVIIVEPTKPEVSITSIYLGYFLSKNYNPYLQPIFIFEGPSFVAYVSAISEEYFEINAPTQIQAR